jgi:mRNA interferase MazF
MGRIKQYWVYWVELSPTQGHEITKTRPCAIVSPDELNNWLNTVVVVPLTSIIHYYPFRVRRRERQLAKCFIRNVLYITNLGRERQSSPVVSLVSRLKQLLKYLFPTLFRV